MEIDKDIEKFIATNVNSLVMWELLVFLWNNPGITDNTEGISARLGRRSSDLKEPLLTLCKNKILQKWGDNDDPVFVYQPSSKLEKAIEKFVQFNNSKQGKLIIWSQLLKHGMR
ncbi:hypothetical protein K8S19_04535 [bacterium]|nr:hypothetical protein [bacterium]